MSIDDKLKIIHNYGKTRLNIYTDKDFSITLITNISSYMTAYGESYDSVVDRLYDRLKRIIIEAVNMK